MTKIDPDTLAWVETAAGRRALRSEALRGGLHTHVHRCWFDGGRSAVVRHIADVGWRNRDPGLTTREAIAQRLAAPTGLPAPNWLADDPSSGRLLMSWLPGRMVFDPDGLRLRSAELSAIPARIAAVPLAAQHGLAHWVGWVPDEPRSPRWGRNELWQRAIEAYAVHEPDMGGESVLLHRDLHPLNLLWDEDVLTGIVDWTFACVGHPHAELGHFRWNLAVLAGRELANDVLDRYLDATGSGPYSAWWDIASLLGLPHDEIGYAAWHAVGRTDLDHNTIVAATEDLLADALRRLGV